MKHNEAKKLGTIIEIAPNCLVIMGSDKNPQYEPTSSTVLLYKFLDALYIIDTGASPEMYLALQQAIERLKPFESITLINTDAHPDHVAHNTIIQEIKVKEKHHFVDPLLLEKLKDPKKAVLDDLKTAGHYSFLGKPEHIFTEFFEQLGPINSSPDTAQAFNKSKEKTIYFGKRKFQCWELEDGHVKVLASGGHTAGSCMIYLPELKLLFTNDETVSFFPFWPSSTPAAALDTLESIKHMIKDKFVEKIIGSHNQQIFTNGTEALDFIEDLLLVHARFDDLMRKNLVGLRETPQGDIRGATIDELYESLHASSFVSHLPHWETYTKMLILNKLRDLGAKRHEQKNKNEPARYTLSGYTLFKED